MKKSICFCAILCMALLAGCAFWPNNGAGERMALDDSDLIPTDARSMTISYRDDAGNPAEPELKTYQADPQCFRQFCDFIQAANILRLTDHDALAFSNIASADAAAITVRFDTGDPLYIDIDGGISRFTEHEAMNSPKAEWYFVSRDDIHQLQKILIPDFEKDHQALGFDPNFIQAADENTDSVKEIPILLPRGRRAFACSDGIIALHAVWNGSATNCFLRVVKYDKRGVFLWVQNHTDIKLDGNWYSFSECIETRDGGFVFSVHGSVWFHSSDTWVPGDKEEAVITPGWLIKCDNSGKIRWKEQLEFRGGAEAQWLCETENGDILTAGTCQTDDGEHYKTGDNTHGYTDLLLMKFDQNGKLVTFKKYGGPGFDSFRDARYSSDLGWVVWGTDYSRQFLAVFDDDLKEKWQYVFQDQHKIFTTCVVVVGQQIYVTGSLFAGIGKQNQTVVFKFSSQGTLLASQTIDTEMVAGICAAADDTVLVYVNPSADNNTSDMPQIYRLDENLDIKQTIHDAAVNAFEYQVIPTNDNGFFTVQMQTVKGLPQPIWMSRSMTDSATVLSRYDAAGKLLYRKTYNKNHEVEAHDLVIPLPDGSVIIDR